MSKKVNLKIKMQNGHHTDHCSHILDCRSPAVIIYLSFCPVNTLCYIIYIRLFCLSLYSNKVIRFLCQSLYPSNHLI